MKYIVFNFFKILLKKPFNIISHFVTRVKKIPRVEKLFIFHFYLVFSLTFILFRIFHQLSEITTTSEIKLIENLLVGLLTSYYFYIIVVFLPEFKRIRIIRDNFYSQINLFKKDTISVFLSSIELVNEEKIKKLMDIKYFRDYFKEEYVEGQTRWQKVLTDIDEDKVKLNELISNLVFLRDECQFIMGKIQINDERTYSFLKRLSNVIFALKNNENVGANDLENFFWPLFSGWNYTKGYQDIDVLDRMIDRI